MRNAVSYAFFKINQSGIIQKWCVNKNKPQLRCHGHCYLGQKVLENEARTPFPKTPLVIIEESFRVVISNTITTIFRVPEMVLPIQYVDNYLILYSQLFIVDIFRPPRFF